MFFGLARQPDPLAETRAFQRRAEQARRRGRTAEDDRRAVAAAFAAPPRRAPRFDLTRRDTERRMAERFPAPPLGRAAERLPGARQRAEIRAYRPTLSERVGDLIHDGARAIGLDRITANRMRDEAVHLPVVGDGLTGLEGLTDIRRGNFLAGAGQIGLAAVGAAPGVGDVAAAGFRGALRGAPRRGGGGGSGGSGGSGGGSGGGGGGGLPMDEASRLARAEAMGYSPRPFWHGDRNPAPLPDQYPGPGATGTYFARDPGKAEGFARQGGHTAREYRLRNERPFNDTEITVRDYADVVAALRRSDDEAAALELAAGFPVVGYDTPEQLFDLAARQPDASLDVGSGALLRQAIKQNSRFLPESVLREAGFDAIDTGGDVLKLTSEGIRLRSATFDPERASSRNINHGLVPVGLGVGGLGLYGYGEESER